MRQLFKFVLKVLVAAALDLLIVVSVSYGAFRVYDEYKNGTDRKIHELYKELVTQTGQVQDAVPLLIIDDDTQDNAYNDGTKVVIFTGLIKKHSWDSIALILGHEIAHGMLGHFNVPQPVPQNIDHTGMGKNDFDAVLESVADKLGAIYMMKAGYNVCKAREVFKEWKKEGGNYLGLNHPDYDYRYAELNVNCGGE